MIAQNQKFAHYVILEKVGEGGMGVVYRARDEKLQRDVALKFLGPLITGSSASHESVLQEARAISALNHPNICTVYEVGEADGQPYIAMEFIEGRPLTADIVSTGMSLQQVERYGIQLADALSHAHSRGIVHRDLKAANVIITPSGLLKVLDFGISRRLSSSAPGRDETTVLDASWESQHSFTGTLPYIAPELLKGQQADERSDIWSLGVILYEMLAGRRPFRGATAYELSAAILRENPPPIDRQLPAVLRSIVDKCLNKDPGTRYQSAGEVKAALETAGEASRTEPIITPPAEPTSFWNWRTVLLLAGVVALAIGLGYWASSRKSHRPAPMPGAIQSIAVLPLENLSGDPSQEYFADGMTDALITELSQIKKLRVISRTSAMQYKGTHKSLQEIAQELNVDAIVEGTVVRSNNRVRISANLVQTNAEGSLWADNFERDFTDVLALQSEVATAIARGIQVELTSNEQNQLARSRSVVPDAYENYLKGKYELDKRTPEGIRQAANYFETAVNKDPTFAVAWAGLADTYLTMSNYELKPARELMPIATQAAEKALQLDDNLAEAHTSLAAIRYYFLEGGDIENEFLRAIALNPGYSTSLHWYALYLAGTGRHEESIREIKLAREIDPKSLIINSNVAWCYYLAGDYDRAVDAAKSAIQMDPSFGIAYGYLGQAYLEKKQYDEAINAFRTFVSLSPGNYARLAELTYAYAIAGKTAQAQDLLHDFQSAKDSKYISQYDWATVYAGFRDKEKTLAALERSYDDRNGRVINLAVHPQFAFLRDEPRFRDLVARMGMSAALPQQSTAAAQ